jgi:hypothetical protein
VRQVGGVSATVPPMRIAPDGLVVVQLRPGAPWVALRGDRERGRIVPDRDTRRWPSFRLAPYGVGGGRDPRPWERYGVSRETCPH